MRSVFGKWMLVGGIAVMTALGARDSVAVVDATGIAEAVQAIAQGSAEAESDALLLMRDGEVLLESYSSPVAAPIETMSVTKSVVALAIGALLTDGKIASLEMPLHQLFPEWKQGRKQSITLRMLLDHSSGLQDLPSTEQEIYPAPDVLQLALAAELSATPGERFQYSNKAVNLLAGVISRVAGEPMDSYVQRRVFAPLGIASRAWARDSAGNPYAMAGLALTARGLAALGQLVLNRGQWQGKTVIAADYIDAMLAPSRLSDEVGLLWWRRPAWVRFHADADSFAALQKVGIRAERIDQLRRLDGRAFDSPAALYAGLSEALGADWNRIWQDEMIKPHGIGPWRPFHPQQGPVQLFAAEGWLGQYLLLVPEARLVAVRQIRDRDGLGAHTRYSDFSQRVQRLADRIINGKDTP